MLPVQAIGIDKKAKRCARCKLAGRTLYRTHSGACTCRVLCARCIDEVNQVAAATKKGGRRL
jgi:hypothetical protein